MKKELSSLLKVVLICSTISTFFIACDQNDENSTQHEISQLQSIEREDIVRPGDQGK